MLKIKNSWTYRNFQLIIIMGLVVGIALVKVDFLSYLPGENNIKYVKTDEVKKDCTPQDRVCIVDAMLDDIARETYAANREVDLEKYRLDGMVILRDVILERMDNSPFVDYQDLEEKYTH